MFKKKFIFCFLMIFAVSLTIFCFTSSTFASDGDTLIIAVNSPTETIDPMIGTDVPSTRLTTASYETLVRYKPGTYEIEPFLATDWSYNENRTEYTFELREDVKFHDGASLDSDAVITAFNRILEMGEGESYLVRHIDEIEKIDNYTVKFILEESSPEFLFSLARQFIVSPKAIEDHEEDGDWARDWFSRNTAGTGPYKLTSWEEDTEYIFDKHEDYWRGWDKDHFSRLLFRIVREPSTQRMLLERGEIDVAENLVREDFPALEWDPEIRVEIRETPKPFYIAMNTERSPLDNLKVRKAIAYTLDYESAIEDAMLGAATPMYGPVPREFPGHNSDLQPLEQDLERAEELLAEAGYPDGGFTLTYLYLEHWLFERTVGLILAEDLAKLGIEMEIQAQPWATMTARMADPDERPDLVMYAQTTPTPSPLSIMEPMYHSESGHWSHFTYSNERVDELLEKAPTILDDQERHEVYKEIQEIVYYDYPQIFVFDESDHMVFRDNVKGTIPLLSWGGKILNYYDLYRE